MGFGVQELQMPLTRAPAKESISDRRSVRSARMDIFGIFAGVTAGWLETDHGSLAELS